MAVDDEILVTHPHVYTEGDEIPVFGPVTYKNETDMSGDTVDLFLEQPDETVIGPRVGVFTAPNRWVFTFIAGDLLYGSGQLVTLVRNRAGAPGTARLRIDVARKIRP